VVLKKGSSDIPGYGIRQSKGGDELPVTEARSRKRQLNGRLKRTATATTRTAGFASEIALRAWKQSQMDLF